MLLHGKGEKSYIKIAMYDKIRELFESGEIDRLLRLNGVRKRDWEDFKQEVAVILLTASPQKVQDLTRYAMGVIKRQYHSRKSSWYLTYKAWDEQRTELADALREIPDTGGQGDMERGQPQSPCDVPRTAQAGRKRTDNLPAGGGTWKHSGGSQEAQMPPQHRYKDIQQDKRQDK